MPQFVADFIPDGLDDFTSGYLQCAEFTNPADELLAPAEGEESTEVESEMLEIIGWSPESIATAKSDCAKFQADNAALLESYYEESGRTEESAGNDFWYSRNGHGAGFFDRGKAPCFDALQDAARKWSDVDVYVSDVGHLELS